MSYKINVYDKYLNALDDIELEGSTRQISWAANIRYKFTIYIKSYYEEEELRFYTRFLKEHLNASWWIDNRDNFRLLKNLYEMYCEEKA